MRGRHRPRRHTPVSELINRYRKNYPGGQPTFVDPETGEEKPTRAISLDETAKLTGIPANTLSRWQRGLVDFHILTTIEALCAGLKIPRAEFDEAVFEREP